MKYTTREVSCDNKDYKLQGIWYAPETKDKVPLAIFSHGFGATLEVGLPYAEELASNGVAVYLENNRYVNHDREFRLVDTSRIILIGESQGGVVSAVTGERHPEETVGLILLYNAFAIPDDNVKPYKSKDEVPEDKDIWNGWMTIGKIYVTDIWDYDFYCEMKHFTKPVCIIHGSNDGLVKLSFSERAVKCYPNAELHAIEGADHGFKGNYVKECNKYIIDFLKKLKFIQ
ncbi:hypothetical protein M9Y10_032408 [Tritrichomonas musculus]|uniref:Uncharacterized protein n=1 Tax=Tritrichomonas musculus TaxID=1915356 RepID=A0ABR2GYC3_9EUKA